MEIDKPFFLENQDEIYVSFIF